MCLKNLSFSISPQFSPTTFDPDANSVLLRAHLCTAVDHMRRKSCVRSCSRERRGLYNGNVQQNPLCAASCHQGYSHISPVLTYRYDFSSRCKFSTSTSTMIMYSSIKRLYAQNPVFEIVREESVKVYLHMYNGNVQQNLQRVESCVTNPVFEIVQGSVKVCTTGIFSRTLYT